jgi:hypothetical protein
MPVISNIISHEGKSFRRRLLANYILEMEISEINVLKI